MRLRLKLCMRARAGLPPEVVTDMVMASMTRLPRLEDLLPPGQQPQQQPAGAGLSGLVQASLADTLCWSAARTCSTVSCLLSASLPRWCLPVCQIVHGYVCTGACCWSDGRLLNADTPCVTLAAGRMHAPHLCLLVAESMVQSRLQLAHMDAHDVRMLQGLAQPAAAAPTLPSPFPVAATPPLSAPDQPPLAAPVQPPQQPSHAHALSQSQAQTPPDRASSPLPAVAQQQQIEQTPAARDVSPPVVQEQRAATPPPPPKAGSLAACRNICVLYETLCCSACCGLDKVGHGTSLSGIVQAMHHASREACSTFVRCRACDVAVFQALRSCQMWRHSRW